MESNYYWFTNNKSLWYLMQNHRDFALTYFFSKKVCQKFFCKKREKKTKEATKNKTTKGLSRGLSTPTIRILSLHNIKPYINLKTNIHLFIYYVLTYFLLKRFVNQFTLKRRKKPWKHWVFKAFMAPLVGLEPTTCGLTVIRRNSPLIFLRPLSQISPVIMDLFKVMD